MASGPEHYAQAEVLLARADQELKNQGVNDYTRIVTAMAQVHAQLAEAANSALIGDMDDPEFLDQLRAWRLATVPTETPSRA